MNDIIAYLKVHDRGPQNGCYIHNYLTQWVDACQKSRIPFVILEEGYKANIPDLSKEQIIHWPPASRVGTVDG